VATHASITPIAKTKNRNHTARNSPSRNRKANPIKTATNTNIVDTPLPFPNDDLWRNDHGGNQTHQYENRGETEHAVDSPLIQ
jgi:hypothetical protein